HEPTRPSLHDALPIYEEQVDHELFDDAEAWAASDMESYRQEAAAQLGTVGSGNHYVDLLRDEDGFVWIGVHFGSRGLGHTSATRDRKSTRLNSSHQII